MTQDEIIHLCKPYFGHLIEDGQHAFTDFDTLEPGIRLTVEKARPKFVHERLLALWEQRYGRDGRRKARMAEDCQGIKFLLIEGPKFCVGLRNKRLNRDFISSNHKSDHQSELRGTQSFPEFNMHVAHVFFGLRWTRALVPALSDMSITFECLTVQGRHAVEWRYTFWNASEGDNPQFPTQPLLIPPQPQPKSPLVKPKSDAPEMYRSKHSQGG